MGGSAVRMTIRLLLLLFSLPPSSSSSSPVEGQLDEDARLATRRDNNNNDELSDNFHLDHSPFFTDDEEPGLEVPPLPTSSSSSPPHDENQHIPVHNVHDVPIKFDFPSLFFGNLTGGSGGFSKIPDDGDDDDQHRHVLDLFNTSPPKEEEEREKMGDDKVSIGGGGGDIFVTNFSTVSQQTPTSFTPSTLVGSAAVTDENDAHNAAVVTTSSSSLPNLEGAVVTDNAGVVTTTVGDLRANVALDDVLPLSPPTTESNSSSTQHLHHDDATADVARFLSSESPPTLVTDGFSGSSEVGTDTKMTTTTTTTAPPSSPTSVSSGEQTTQTTATFTEGSSTVTEKATTPATSTDRQEPRKPNKHAPVFENSPYEALLPRRAPTDYVVFSNIHVVDADKNLDDGLNVTCIAYPQFPDVCTYFLVVPTGVDSEGGNFSASLVLQNPLPTPAKTVYQVKLLATDGKWNSTTTVTIVVGDNQIGSDILPPNETLMTALLNDTLTNGFHTTKVQSVDETDYFKPEFQGLFRPSTNSLPYFSANTTNVAVPEDLLPGSLVPNLELFVTDDDVGQNASFVVQLFDTTGSFVLDAAEADGSAVVVYKSARLAVRLRNQSHLDFENEDFENPDYDFSFVICVIVPKPDNKTECAQVVRVVIDLYDVNDNYPQFAQDSYTVHVPEDTPPGTVVGNVTALDRDSGNFGTAGIRYSLHGTGSEKFVIDPISGAISVAACNGDDPSNCLDYEEYQHYTLTVTAADDLGNGLRQSVAVDFELEDANDNAVRFSQPAYEADYKLGVGLAFPLFVQATDLDVTSVVRYGLLQPLDSGVKVNATSGEITFDDNTDLQLTGALSHRLTLLVQATDGKFTDTAWVNITIQDDNQFPPVFTHDTYNATISDASNPGFVVVHVSATDADRATGGQVSYYILYGGQGNFVMDAATGIMSVSRKHHLDYDTQMEYDIQVAAVDGGIPSQRGTARVLVTITDGNNKPPTFTPPLQRAHVRENTPVGGIVYHVTALDADATSPNALRFAFHEEPPVVVNQRGKEVGTGEEMLYRGLFTIDESSGDVKVATSISREMASLVSMKVVAVDTSADPPQTGTGTLVVTIVGESGHLPIFPLPWTPEQPHLSVRLREESPVGTLVLSLVVADPESELQRFRINPSSPFFEVNSLSGVVTVKSRVDYEQTPSTWFLVEAYEDGHPTRLAVANVTVDVVDINDSDPVFPEAEYRLSVEENSFPGTEIANVSASDLDSGDFGRLTYSLEGEHRDYFFVGSDGILAVAPGAVLDREATETLTLQLMATDQAADPAERKFASVPVFVSLTDVNDSPPVFTSRDYTATIVPNMAPGQPILQVTATDKDHGVNASLKYSIGDGNERGAFWINETSGVITLLTHLSGGSGTYTLNVVAQDQNGVGPHQDSAVVVIHVAEMNAHAPKFVAPNVSEVFIEENQPEGTVLATAEADDLDFGENGRVSYFFHNGTDTVSETPQFAIDPDTGVITTRMSLDREAKSMYQLTLVAKDNGTPYGLDSVFVLNVKLEDIDDNFPEFPIGPFSHPYSFSVSENQPIHTSVGQVEARDQDSDVNGRVYYSIIGGNDDDHFVLDPDTGILRTNTILDHESKTQYRLAIKASNQPESDAAVSTRKRRQLESTTETPTGDDASVALVHVKVENENDNPPVFVGLPYQTGVKYTAKVGEYVTQVKAVDPDGDNVTYSLIASHLFRTKGRTSSGAVVPQPFSIDPSGKIYTAALLSSYNQDRFQLSVIAKEGMTPHRETKATVEVWIYEPSELLRVVVARPRDDIMKELPEYIAILSNITKGNVYIDDIHYHLSKRNEIDKEGTDLYIHVVDPDAYVIKSVPEVLDTVDSTFFFHPEYYKLHLTSVEPVYTPVTREPFNPALAALIALLVVLFIGFVIIVFVCCCTHYWIKQNKIIVVKKNKKTPATGTGPDTLFPTHFSSLSSYKENPLWMEQKLKPYEEQELSMQVFSDMMADRSRRHHGGESVSTAAYPRAVRHNGRGGDSQGTIGSASILEASMNLGDDYTTLEREPPQSHFNDSSLRHQPRDRSSPIRPESRSTAPAATPTPTKPSHGAPSRQAAPHPPAPTTPSLVFNQNGEPVMVGELL